MANRRQSGRSTRRNELTMQLSPDGQPSISRVPLRARPCARTTQQRRAAPLPLSRCGRAAPVLPPVRRLGIAARSRCALRPKAFGNALGSNALCCADCSLFAVIFRSAALASCLAAACSIGSSTSRTWLLASGSARRKSPTCAAAGRFVRRRKRTRHDRPHRT